MLNWMEVAAGDWQARETVPSGQILAQVRWDAPLVVYSVAVKFVFTHPRLAGQQGDRIYRPTLGSPADARDLCDLWAQELADHYRTPAQVPKCLCRVRAAAARPLRYRAASSLGGPDHMRCWIRRQEDRSKPSDQGGTAYWAAAAA